MGFISIEIILGYVKLWCIRYPDLGKILINVEKNGEAYYINPQDRKAYFLGRPADAFEVMKRLGLGITNENIRKIDIGEIQ